MWFLLILITLIAAILLIAVVLVTQQPQGVHLLPTTNPTNTGDFYQSINLEEITLSPISIYLPLNSKIKNISNKEEILISTDSLLSTNQISEEFGCDQLVLKDCTDYLSKYGEILWISSSKTCLIFQPNISFYKSLNFEDSTAKNFYCNTENTFINENDGSTTTYANIGSLNNYITLPFGMISNALNYVQASTPVKKLKDWIPTLNSTSTPPVSGSSNLNSSLSSFSISGQNNSIALIQIGQIINANTLVYFTQYYNYKYNTSFSDNYFSENVICVNVDEFLNLNTFPLPTSSLTPQESFDYDFANNVEALLDIISVFEGNANMKIYLFYGMIPSQFNLSSLIYDNLVTIYYDFFTLWEFLLENSNFLPSVVSNSYYGNFKINVVDYQRISLEGRLLSLQGFSFFDASGDTSAWLISGNNSDGGGEDYIPYLAPDFIFGAFFGDSVISVGGFNPNFGNTFGVNDYFTMGIIGNPFSGSSGGYLRGYPIPEWKKSAEKTYSQFSNTIQFQLGSDSLPVVMNQIEIEKGGNIFPDLIFNGVTQLLDQPQYPVTGTSLASPYLATLFASIISSRGKGIPALHRIIYSKSFRECLIRKIDQHSGYGVLTSYYPVLRDNVFWDPVNGLGIPQAEMVKNLLMDTTKVIIN